ncbi:DUF544 family protein [Cavenderia fasciculata]|uniref:DUF544 family protein n=1 Tax=Cavenderia fasciculata TaxID=261658 RepID=F4Q3J6_CACFS|nr:DUF544 family protein [Cavenderia fasciculata]EGG17654.1 DUF544 family protein [Cavenderia fasciculata]|eukprot:XP_004356138.1 DUF544 family protein [Cavenderia fasciculata]
MISDNHMTTSEMAKAALLVSATNESIPTTLDKEDDTSTSTTSTTTTTTSNNNNNSTLNHEEIKRNLDSLSINETTTSTTSTTTTTAPVVVKEQQFFSVKSFEFKGKRKCIVTQRENGPCPLIAIINLLSLNGKINVPEGAPVTYDTLITRIGSYLLESSPNFEDEEMQIDHEIKMNHAINILPSLINGLILDIKFTGIRDFDTSCDTNIFEALNVDLVHGWLVDPQDVELTSVIGQMTYNQLTDKLYIKENGGGGGINSSNGTINIVNNRKMDSVGDGSMPLGIPSTSPSMTTSTTSTTSTSNTTNNTNNLYPSFKDEEEDSYTSGFSNTEDLANDIRIAQFLKDTSSQLSYHGLCELHTQIKDESLAILFRNNHFSTIYKNESGIYILVSDEGFINEPVVWEKLSQINGDSDFLLSDFSIYKKLDPYSTFTSNPTTFPHPSVQTTASVYSSPTPQLQQQKSTALSQSNNKNNQDLSQSNNNNNNQNNNENINNNVKQQHQEDQAPPPINPDFMTDEEYARYLLSQQSVTTETKNDYQLALELQHQINQKPQKNNNKKPKEKKEKDKTKDCLIQ